MCVCVWGGGGGVISNIATAQRRFDRKRWGNNQNKIPRGGGGGISDGMLWNVE